MSNTNVLALPFAITLSAMLAACTPTGGPSAHGEADQYASTSKQATQQWAREDLVSKSTTGNIKMPAPGFDHSVSEFNQ